MPRKKQLITVSILTALLLTRFLLMPQMDSYLVLEHELRDAGAIVLLLGNTPVETHGCAYTLRHGERSAATVRHPVEVLWCHSEKALPLMFGIPHIKNACRRFFVRDDVLL